MAQLARWDDHYKFVYLTTALRGTAKAFYRSCSPKQKGNYPSLVAELKKRFTPFQLTATQTQLFHDCKQGSNESVDEFAQDLRKLYSKAYAGFTKGTPEAEKVGQNRSRQPVCGRSPPSPAGQSGWDGGGTGSAGAQGSLRGAKSKELTAARPGAATKPNKGSAPSG